jgi:sigma-54-specific transcriptional regulator
MLRLPPLRERPGDILPLAHRFLEIYGPRLGYTTVTLAPEAAHQLLTYPWPGNIRELENVIHHALLVCHDTLVRPEDLRLPAPRPGKTVRSIPELEASSHLEHALQELFEHNRSDLYQHIDATVIRSAFEYCERNQVRTARLLGISRNIVRDRLFRYGLLKTPT